LGTSTGSADMDAISSQRQDVETIKSVTLADLQFGRPSPFDRITSLAKTALMLWGALSFGAGTGAAMYYVAGVASGPVLVSETQASDTIVAEAVDERDPSLAEIPPHLDDYLESTPEALVEPPPPAVAARLPRPRPDEPVITGSIEPVKDARAEYNDPREARPQYAGPCEALQALGARFIFGLRCGRQTRAYPPAPQPLSYYPASPTPYQPPHMVR
jgi:hypothetical protein